MCITAGLRHIRFWYIDREKISTVNQDIHRRESVKILGGRSAVLEHLRDNTFIDIVFGNNTSIDKFATPPAAISNKQPGSGSGFSPTATVTSRRHTLLPTTSTATKATAATAAATAATATIGNSSSKLGRRLSVGRSRSNRRGSTNGGGNSSPTIGTLAPRRRELSSLAVQYDRRRTMVANTSTTLQYGNPKSLASSISSSPSSSRQFDGFVYALSASGILVVIDSVDRTVINSLALDLPNAQSISLDPTHSFAVCSGKGSQIVIVALSELKIIGRFSSSTQPPQSISFVSASVHALWNAVIDTEQNSLFWYIDREKISTVNQDIHRRESVKILGGRSAVLEHLRDNTFIDIVFGNNTSIDTTKATAATAAATAATATIGNSSSKLGRRLSVGRSRSNRRGSTNGGGNSSPTIGTLAPRRRELSSLAVQYDRRRTMVANTSTTLQYGNPKSLASSISSSPSSSRQFDGFVYALSASGILVVIDSIYQMHRVSVSTQLIPLQCAVVKEVRL
ncbi:hypothetical protein GQ42DRAFT_157525 [Ramicandelaber brevisporus]|nr:hypothetical protein GQ42DRAFT_157525 [Ramicandelaber brevisporus]